MLKAVPRRPTSVCDVASSTGSIGVGNCTSPRSSGIAATRWAASDIRDSGTSSRRTMSAATLTVPSSAISEKPPMLAAADTSVNSASLSGSPEIRTAPSPTSPAITR